MEDLTPIEGILPHLPLEHLVGMLVVMVISLVAILTFAWKVIKEILKRNKNG